MRNCFFILCLLILGCDTGKLKVVMDLPIALNEVSGLETDINNDLFWMVNDSGNKPILYGLNTVGNIVKSIKIKAKNRDWEDLTIDPDGNIYIGNFGNNDNDSNNLSILKIHAAIFIFNLLGANLRHSHIPIRFGKYFERVFISPAQHQIHHSNDSIHFDKNFGSIFAFWDGLFGTLEISQQKQKIVIFQYFFANIVFKFCKNIGSCFAI